MKCHSVVPGVLAGATITIVAVSHMVVEAVRARAHLAEIGISAEIIDPVSLAPLDGKPF